MRIVKITKHLLKKGPYQLLKYVGAYDLFSKQAFPHHTYVSQEDYKYMIKSVRKRSGYYTWMDNFNYGPNMMLAKAIKPGYMLIDDEAIRKQSWLIWEE